MVATNYRIIAQKRDDRGKQQVRKLRNTGRLPGVLSLNDGSAQEVSFDQHSFELSLRGHGLEGRLLEVEVDGDSHGKYVLKDVHYHPVSGKVMHVDFVQIALNKRMRSTTQIIFIGTPAGIEAGGIVEYHLREVEIECLPKDLVDSLRIDVAGLNIGDSLSVEDLALPEGVKITTAAGIAIVSVSAPRLRAAEETEGAAPAEGEEAAAETKAEGDDK